MIYQWSEQMKMFEIEHTSDYNFEKFLTCRDNISIKHIKRNVNNEVETKIWRVLNAFI